MVRDLWAGVGGERMREGERERERERMREGERQRETERGGYGDFRI